MLEVDTVNGATLLIPMEKVKLVRKNEDKPMVVIFENESGELARSPITKLTILKPGDTLE